MFDTNDISTIRGSSMCLEKLGEKVADQAKQFGATLVDFGASRAVLQVADDKADAMKTDLQAFLKTEPWRHFRLILGQGNSADAARADARLGQLRQWSQPLPDKPDGLGPDALDLMRPATQQDVAPGGSKRLLSKSTAARRDMGRKLRPNMFDDTRYVPAPSFEDLVDTPSAKPMVVQGKLAVIVADGIGIGKLADNYASKLDFSKAIQAFRQRIGKAIVAWAQDDARKDAMIGQSDSKNFARVDVLVWGGDDMTLALPASHLMSFLPFLMEQFAKPFDGASGPALHHRIGCIVANHKVPIRQMRALASDAEQRLKAVAQEKGLKECSLVSIDVFESAALPHASLAPYRKAMYGPQIKDAELTFTASDYSKLMEFLVQTIGDENQGIAISQMYRALQAAEGQSLVAASEQVIKVLSGHFTRRGQDFDVSKWTGGYGIGTRNLPAFLALAAQLRPYAEASQ